MKDKKDKTIYTRTACNEDITRIAQIAASANAGYWTPAYISDRLCREDTFLTVAVKKSDTETAMYGDDENSIQPGETTGIIGFAALRQVGDDCEILEIAVEETHKRRGTGSLLLAEMFAIAAKKALKSMFLEVRTSNSPAIGLYKKFGFQKIRTVKNYYDKPVEDAVIMGTDCDNIPLDTAT